MEQNEILWAKTNPNAIIPSKRDEDAGYDIYACFEEDSIIIPKHSTYLIPTGIATAFNPLYYMQIEERGSTGSKGIKVSSGIIDSGYRGEWFIAITNSNDMDLVIAKKLESYELYKNIIIYPYHKAIAQAIVHRVHSMKCKEVDYETLKSIKSERGVGKIGASEK